MTVVRHHVRSFGDEGDVGVPVAGHAFGDGRGDVGDAIDAREGRVFVGQPVRVESDAAHAHGAELHLGLPLVDVGVGLAGDAGVEAVGTQLDETALGVDVVLRAHAFGAGRGDDEIAAGLENIDGADHALDSLVVGLVERVAGGAGDDGVEATA